MAKKQSDAEWFLWMATENESAVENPSCQCRECNELRREAALYRRASFRCELVPQLETALMLLAKHIAALERHRANMNAGTLAEVNETGVAMHDNKEAYRALAEARGTQTGGAA